MNCQKNLLAACLLVSLMLPSQLAAEPKPSDKPEVRSEASLNSVPVSGETVVVTEADRAKGKENVKNVNLVK